MCPFNVFVTASVCPHYVHAPVDVDVVIFGVAPHKRFSQCTQWRNKKNLKHKLPLVHKVFVDLFIPASGIEKNGK